MIAKQSKKDEKINKIFKIELRNCEDEKETI